MNSVKFCLIFCSAFLSSTAIANSLSDPLLPPQFSMPSPGKIIDKDFDLKTDAAFVQPCIALATHDKSIFALISKDLLNKLAVHAKGRGYGNESERLMLIQGGRAQELLASVSSNRDIQGCAKAALSGEVPYLLARLLDSGQVTIFDVQAKQVVPTITANVNAKPGIAGMVSYYFHGKNGERRTFFSYRAWVH